MTAKVSAGLGLVGQGLFVITAYPLGPKVLRALGVDRGGDHEQESVS